MPKFLKLTSPSGNHEFVDIAEFNKNPNAYGKYKIQMVNDSTGENFNIPATMFGQAQKDGLRAWNMDKQTTKRKQVQNPAFQTPMQNGNLPADWGNAEMVNPKGFDAFGTNVPTTKAQQDAKDFVQGFDDAIKGRKTDGTDAWRDTMQRMANMNVQSAQKQFEDQIDYAQATGKPLTDDFLVQNLRNEENGFSMNKFGVAPTVARDKDGKPILDQKGDPVKGWTTDDVRASVERQTDIAARQRELELNKKTTEEKLSDLYRQRESLKKKLDTGDKFTSMYQSQYGTHGVNNREAQLQLIEVEKAIQSLEAVRDKDELAWNGFFRGFENTAGNLRSWDFGLSDLALMGKMEEIKGKIDKGQQLTADEQELATSKIGADAAAALEDETMGNTYRWAKIGGESLPFMADFMLTGGYRGIAVKFAREASKLATKTLARNVLRNTGTLIGDVVGAYGMALTTQAGKTTADILRRHQGSLTVDENGNFKFEGGESMPSAIAHGLNAAAIENYTEKFGEHLNFAKAFGKYGTEGMTQFFQNLSNKGWAKTMNAVAKRGGINGYIPEVIEEEIGLPLNALITGDNSWSDVLDVKQQADILGGMAISIGAMGALGLGVHLGKKGTTRLAARHYESKLNDADFNAAMAFDHGKWLDLKDVIDNTENKYMPSVQDRIIKSPALTPEQKIAANKYINTLLTYRGFNIGLMANMNNAEHEQQPARTVITPTQIDGKTSYAITYYNENGEEIGTAPQVFNTLENAETYKQMLDEKKNDIQLQDLYSSIYIKDRDGSMRQSLDQQLQTVGLSLNDISRILNKSPFRRTDKEIQALDIMQNIANGMVYPPNEVHEEKDAQDGADLAEGTPVGDQATIDIVNEREANAISQWNQVADPDLQSSIKDLYEQGKTSNDIFDWLVANEYSDEVIAAFAELCNSGAQKDKFIEVTGQKIEEQVNQKVQQVTFAGTLNGSKNPIVLQVQDQTGAPMYIVSGNINMDEQGTLISDGLIILRDENGNFIQRPDTNGLTLVGTQNADEYRNQLLTQTQEAVTAQIQATEYKAPEYNDSDMETQAPEAPQGNGLTVPQPAAQSADTNEQQEPEQAQEPAIPTDEDGNLLYHKAPIEATINELYDGKLDDEEIRDFVQNRINESSKEYDKANKKKPKIGTDKNAYLQAKTQWQSQVDEAKQQLDYWNSVQNYIQQQTHTTPEEIKAAQDELSGTTARLEYARQAPEGATTPEQIAGEFVKDAKIQPEDFYRETGLTAADARKQYPGMLSNNGATIASLAEQLVQYDNDNYGGMFFKGDDMEARNYIIEALKNAPSRKSLGRDMTAEEQEYARVREQQREDFYQEAYGMSYSDYLAFEEQEMPNIWRRISNFAPEQYDQMVAEYYESLPEDYFTPQNEQQNGTEGQQDNGLADSTTVLPQPPTDNETGSGQREDPATETGTGSEGDNQNEEVPGGTQGVGQQEDKSKKWEDMTYEEKEALDPIRLTAELVLADAEKFAKESKHKVEVVGFNYDTLDVKITVDGKASNITYQSAEEYGENEKGYWVYNAQSQDAEKFSNLLDEYNKGVEYKEKGFEGETPCAFFFTADAAIAFEKWLNDKNNPNDWENLTEEQKAAAIDADTIADENAKELAKDFLRGDNTSTIAEVFYREIVGRYMANEEAPKKKEEKPSKPKPSLQEQIEQERKRSRKIDEANKKAIEILKRKEEEEKAMRKDRAQGQGKRVGAAQFRKFAEKIEEAIQNKDINAIAQWIQFYDNTVSAGGEPFGNEINLYNQAKQILENEGYTIHDYKYMPYNEGMRIEAEFVFDDSLPAGTRIITKVLSPELQKDGVLAKQAKVIVTQTHQDIDGSTPPNDNTPEDNTPENNEPKDEKPATVTHLPAPSEKLMTAAQELLAAIESNDKQAIDNAKANIEKVINNLSHSEVSRFAYDKNNLVKQQNSEARKDAYKFVCKVAKKRADALIQQLNERINESYPGVRVEYNANGFWLNTTPDSKYKQIVKALDNDRRWLTETGLDASVISPINNDTFDKWVKSIGERLSEQEESPKEKTWDEMDENEKMDYVFSQPLLTEEQIKNAQTKEVYKANALAYIKGQKSMVTRLSYYITYKNVKHSTGSSPANNEAGDTSQLDETNSGGGKGRRAERKHSGLGDSRLDSEGSGQTNPNQSGEQLLRSEDSKGRPADDSGKEGDKQVPGDEQPVGRPDTGSDGSTGSSIDNGYGHNVSQQGGKGRSRKNTDTNRRGADKANRDGATGNTQLNSENIDSQLQSEIDEFKNLLADYRNIKNKKNGNINSSIIPGVTINSEKIEAWGRLIYQGAKVGYLLLRKGHTSLSEWSRIMKDMLTPAMHDIEITDAEIDEFIKEMWHCNLPIGDEVHTISEWSRIIQKNKLKEAVRLTLEEKKKKQLDAEPIKVKIADKNNIAETLPYLLPLQQDDVYKAEMQFFDESHNDYDHAYGKGYMFTNGTGTGKTYTGLGIVKRFIKQGKGRVLILTPSSTKVKDWVLDAANLNIKAHNLEEWAKAHKTTATTSKAEGVVVTTYANFRQNQALLEDEFDLVIYDESHRLLENKKGGETEGSKQHYMLTNKDEQWAFSRLQTVNQTYQEIQKTRKQYDSEYDKEKEKFQDEADAKFYLPMLTEHISKHEGYPNLKAIKEKYDSLVKKYNNEVKPQLEKQAKESVKKTKVVFLSATPFNTKENLGYAEGYIFQYPQTEGRIGRRSQFYLTNFGSAYRWRNNRLESRTTNPEAVAAQEVAFSDYLQNQLGTMSGRVIDSEYDYSRDFPTVTFEKADELNTAFEEIKKMEGVINKAFYDVMTNYQYTSVLFEAMKTSCILPRIREHINAGRKVVLFHRRMESARPITPPFQEILNKARVLLDGMTGSKEKNEAKAAIADYEQRFAHMLEWEKTLDLRVPRVQILEEFGDDSVLFFSGKETTKQKNAAVEEFNRDSSPKKIIVIQEASGKEGISLHDVTGENQRVLISLAMPQSPITALQIEGRIYRIGNKSNAIFEYPLLGLDEELITWGQRFNAQVGTTENLALGSKARNLRESFARAVIEHSGDVPLDTQGTGGKEMDEAINQDQTDPFDKSILDFYGNAKTSGRRDNREGKDYYPTPEPLGFMMVKWANLSEGESVLEPSAGHGAIARYVPPSNQLTSVEPSTALFGRLQVLAGGIGRKFENDIFENYNIINKHDVVLMNPPFGTAGRLAIDHVAKAFKHLSEGGRIVAIIPRGSADAKFDKWIQTEKSAALVGEIQLPNITFQNAGTQVACRVVVIDKISNEQMRNEALENATQIELPNNYDKIEDFFEDLRGITMPARTIDQKTKNDKKIMPIIKEFKDEYGDDFSVEFTPTGVIISGVGFDYLNMKGDMLKSLVAAQYARANKIIPRTPSRLTRVITAYETIKKMALKLADMSEEEMENYIRQNINDNTSVSSLSDQFVYEVKKNTRTGQDMHVVSKNKGVNLTDEEYSKAREIAKNNGGYWSRFAGGFIFPSELAAKSFLNGGNTPSAENSQQSNNRLAYSSNTNNVNNSRIVPEDVDKDVSLQIENEFDSAIENLNLTEEEKAELDKHISDYSNKSTIELEDIFYINNSRLGLRNEKKNNLSEMLWRRGSAVSEATSAAGGNIRNEKSGAESPTTANGEYSAVVSRRDGEAEGENTARGNEVQGQHNGPRDIRNSGSDRLLLHEGRRIEEKVLSKNSGTKLSSNQRRLLAAQYAISRELVYRDIRLAALKQSLALEEGKQTSLDEIADVFEKTNTDKEVKDLFDKILAINKRLGTSVDIQASQEEGASGEAGTRRDVHYYLDGFTRTSAGKINIPVVIAHELLHQGTIGAINLVKKGKAEGVLTKEQIDAVNTIIDIYNKVNANPERLSESKRGLANPYEFAAQMVDPRQRRALSMSPLERVIAAANELRAQGNNSLWDRIKNALKTLFGMSDLKKMDKAINTLLDTFSETVHDISMNGVDQSGWGYTSTQLFDKYPTWLSGQTTGTGQHTTQITSTVNTYKKIGEWMKSQGMKGASVLDASSGLGKGTEALRDMGFNVEDVEPYPSETRTKPTYLKYEDIKGKYDVVISNAVLNVIPDDWRADVLKNMADKVKPGGKMIINVRDAKEMERQKQKIELDSPSEILVTDKAGNIRAYQKGFTQKELADWIQSELGEGWTIETAKPSNSGISGRAVVVTRNTDTPLRYRKISDSTQKPKTSEEEKSRMANSATSLAESTNTPIKVISAEEAPEGAKNSKGYYDTRTGEVTIVLDNNTSPFDVQRTVAHEVIGHKGLRGLLGAQNYYKIMNAVYDNLPQDEKDKINEAARRNGWQMYTAMDEYLAEQAENMVWDAKSASLWQNVKHYLAEALRTLGFIIKPNLKDARYWLWLSKNQLKRGDVMSNIKRNALLAKLDKLKEISISKTEYVDENDNEIDEILYRKKVRLQTDPDVSFNLGEYLQGAILWFIKQGNNINTAIKEAFYDYAYSLKKLQEQMEKDLGGKIMDNMNFVLGENHISSIVKERIERFETKQVAELQEMIRDIFGKGRIATNTCETYLYLKSGLERNRVLFMRDWFNAEAKRKIEKELQLSPEAQSIYENIAQGIWQDFDDGNIDEKERDKQLKSALAEAQMEYLNNVYDGFISLRNDLADQQATDSITLSEMYRQLDEYINQYSDFNADKEDKSGLSAFDENKVEGEYSDKRAIEIVESLEHEIGDRREKLWDKVQAVTQFAIDYEYKRGMISKDTYNKCKKMFRWYIPLRGISENTMEDLYAYLGGKNDNNTALKHAKGRWTKAKTPLATAINMAERSIDAAERNYNAQRLYRAANELQRRHPDKVPYVAAMHCWYKLDKNTGEYNLQVPNITDDMSPEQIQDVTRRFEDDMKLAERNGEAIKKTNKAQHVAPFSVKHHANDHIVYVMFNGERRMIIFNGSPRPARVMRREMNPEVNYADAVIRKMSAFATTYNPSFTVANFARDTESALNNVLINENAKYIGNFMLNQAKIVGDPVVGLFDVLNWNADNNSYVAAFIKYKKNEPPKSYNEKMFYEFMENGGSTGFNTLKSIEDIDKMLNRGRTVSAVMNKPIDVAAQYIGYANELLENANRYAAYLTSREAGRSVLRSVHDAKEVSINFNRRGAAGRTVRYAENGWDVTIGSIAYVFKHTHMFFNAAIQAFGRWLINHKNHPIRATFLDIIVPGTIGFCMSIINKMLLALGGDDDDEYANLPYYTRRNNLCIWNPITHNWFILPIAQELSAFYGIGDIAAAYTLDKRLQTGRGMHTEILLQLQRLIPFDYVDPKGSVEDNAGIIVLETLGGDLTSTFIDIALNRTWSGGEIRKENEWNKNDPEYKKCYKNTNKMFVEISKCVNSIGNESSGVIKGKFDTSLTNPANLEYLFNSYFGGTFKDYSNVVDLATNGFSINKTPILRRFFLTPDEKTKYSRLRLKWNIYKEDAQRYEDDLDALSKSKDKGDIILYSKYLGTEYNRPAGYRRMEAFKYYNNIIKRISRAMANAQNDDERQYYETMINEMKREAVNTMDNIE